MDSPVTVLGAEFVNHWTERRPRAVGGIESKNDLPIGAGSLSLNSHSDGLYDGVDVIRSLMDVLSPSPHLALDRRHLDQQIFPGGLLGDAIHATFVTRVRTD